MAHRVPKQRELLAIRAVDIVDAALPVVRVSDGVWTEGQEAAGVVVRWRELRTKPNGVIVSKAGEVWETAAL
jgi:hypothetical protein